LKRHLEVPKVGYSPLVHLAKSIWLSGFSEDNLFVMLHDLTAYFDDAGGADHGFTVVSGWVSTVANWKRFDIDWRLLLAHYDLPYFSMKECAQFKGPFDKWEGINQGTRSSFLRDAADVIKSYVLYGFGSVIQHKEFDAVNRRYTLKEYVGSPYALAGRICTKHVRRWGLKNGYERWKLAFVFDKGTPKSGTLAKLMEREGLGNPIFLSPLDTFHEGKLVQKGLTPLQAADFLAYELRKIHKDDPEELWPIEKYRKSVRALVRVPSFWGKCTKADLESLCENHPKIKPRK
jgi:hypothetical protein